MILDSGIGRSLRTEREVKKLTSTNDEDDIREPNDEFATDQVGEDPRREPGKESSEGRRGREDLKKVTGSMIPSLARQKDEVRETLTSLFELERVVRPRSDAMSR